MKYFKLFFRKNISNSNLEGSEWVQIQMPNNIGVFSCTCAPTGQLCVVNYSGEILMRTGICRDTPHGSGWINIEHTSIMSGIRQIGLGSKSLWALENQGNVLYRAGISKDRPVGTKWVQIPANMSNISVSACDQVKFIKIFFKARFIY